MREWIGNAPAAGADRAAFTEVVNHFAPRVRDFLARSGAPEDAVEDAARSVMLALWQDGSVNGEAAADPWGEKVARQVFTLAALRRNDLLGGAAGAVRLDPAAAFAPSARAEAPMPSLAAVEARLQRIQEQLRRARQRNDRRQAA